MRGFVAILIAVFLIASVETEQPPPRKIVIPAKPTKKIALVLRVVADELDGAADAPDLEEHLIERCEIVFDQNAREFDFPGPDILTRPLARRAIRPVIKSILRYATDEGITTNPMGGFNHERVYEHGPGISGARRLGTLAESTADR